MRSVVGTLLAVLALMLLGPPGVADAHVRLVSVSSSPAGGSESAQVRLVFSEPVQGGFATVTVTDPSRRVVSVGDASITSTVVVQPVAALRPGVYDVGFRVVARDGHPISGVQALTVAGTADATTGPTPSAVATPTSTHGPSHTAAGTSDTAEPRPWLLFVAGLALLVAVVGLVVWRFGSRGA